MPARARARALLIAPILALLLGAGVTPSEAAASSLGLTARYDASASLNYGQGRLAVDSSATVTNDTAKSISTLHFNLAPMRVGTFTRGSVEVDAKAAAATYNDQTITVSLPAALQPGRSTVVRITYQGQLATNKRDKNWLFAKLDGTVQAYRWIPWLSRPTAFNRPNVGDPFVTAVSPHVRVSITSERKLNYATSGDLASSTGLTRTFVARNVRDFNFTARLSYTRLTGSAAGVSIVVHRYSLPGAQMMSWAKRSVETYTRLVGRYPYPTLRIVESGGGHAMESPAMVWIPRGSANLEWLVAHEVAHQWFYAVVGNDQAAEPFADEAIVTLLTREATGKRRDSSCAIKPLDRTLYEYKGCYYGVIYVQGADYLANYRRRVGENAFWSGVQSYYKRHALGLGGTRQLLDSLDAAAPPNQRADHRSRFPRLY
jgi:hypothetical protein